MTDKKPTNITVYRKKNNFNIGIIIFGVIFIYLLVTVLLYLTSNHISAYEVREGSIVNDNAYTGFIIRTENVITAPADGYINYFALENEKVGAKTNIFSISSEKLEFKDTDSDSVEELSTEEQNTIFSKTQALMDHFDEGQFSSIYSLKDSILNTLENKSSQSRQTQLNEMLENNSDLEVYNAEADGIIVYSVDEYENITINDITTDILDKKNYEVTSFKNNTKVKTGDPVYRLITEDEWTIVIPLSDDTAKELTETKSVKVRFLKDNETATASLTIHNTEDCNLGILTFESSMVRYASERYLDIELILDDESGLKIPKSAVVNKDFYIIPDDYLTQGGNSNETGVLLSDGEGNAAFQKAEVYYHDTDEGISYLNPDVFEEDQTIIKPNSSDTYKLKEMKSLKGVYNINKGYAVFKQIKILCESDEYYIVEAGNDYGLSNYDHIALDGEDIQENDIVN